MCVRACVRARGRLVVFVCFLRERDRQTDRQHSRERDKKARDRQILIHTERLRHRQQETERESAGERGCQTVREPERDNVCVSSN